MAKTDKTDKPGPNIILVGDGEPVHTMTSGMSEPIVIAEDEAAQRAGFYHPRAGEIIAGNRPRYKDFIGRSSAESIVGVGAERVEETAEAIAEEAKE